MGAGEQLCATGGGAWNADVHTNKWGNNSRVLTTTTTNLPHPTPTISGFPTDITKNQQLFPGFSRVSLVNTRLYDVMHAKAHKFWPNIWLAHHARFQAVCYNKWFT